MSEHSHHDHDHVGHDHSLRQELVCHFPYATFSVAISFILLGVLQFIGTGLLLEPVQLQRGYYELFHVLHYVHLLFAIVGTVVTFARFSTNTARSFLVSLLSPALFCTLSDVALPALAGNILGIEVDLHICFFCLHDLINVIPFMLVGLITGYAIVYHNNAELQLLSLRSHFVHILISSLAASCYVMSYGFCEWSSIMGILFLFLVGAVVVPCTISDVVVPMYIARWKWKCNS